MQYNIYLIVIYTVIIHIHLTVHQIYFIKFIEMNSKILKLKKKI